MRGGTLPGVGDLCAPFEVEIGEVGAPCAQRAQPGVGEVLCSLQIQFRIEPRSVSVSESSHSRSNSEVDFCPRQHDSVQKQTCVQRRRGRPLCEDGTCTAYTPSPPYPQQTPPACSARNNRTGTRSTTAHSRRGTSASRLLPHQPLPSTPPPEPSTTSTPSSRTTRPTAPETPSAPAPRTRTPPGPAAAARQSAPP